MDGMTTPQEPVALPEDGWLIYKGGRGWYRPNAQGYTSSPLEAGRYTRTEALSYSHPNGLDGPRDGLSIKHESEVPGALPATPSGLVEVLTRMVRLFPEAYDVLTNQEMRDAKGNLRSLIDQQTNALAAMRLALAQHGGAE